MYGTLVVEHSHTEMELLKRCKGMDTSKKVLMATYSKYTKGESTKAIEAIGEWGERCYSDKA